MQKNRYNSGQVGIIMLLITVVMLTIGISAVSRTTSDINISSTNEQSNRALDAAESDVEKALSNDLNTQGPTSTTRPDGIKVDTSVAKFTQLESSVDQGFTVGIDLTGASSVSVNWAKESSCNSQASLVITVLNTGAANAPVRRYYVGPNGCSRNAQDNFTNASGGTAPYKWSYNVPLQANDVLMRIRPLYNGTDLLVRGNNLTTQSYAVKSTAQNVNSKETKAVQVSRTLPVAPSILDYVLFSGTTITQ